MDDRDDVKRADPGTGRLGEQERLVLEATERISERMAEANVSQADLARLLETSRANVSALLSGRRNMRLRTLADLAFVLGRRVSLGLEPLPQEPVQHLYIPREPIAEFCRRHHIRKLELFGSVLREDFASDSDVDVMVEFEDGHTPGLAFFTLHEELAEIFRRPVDLLTRRSVETSPNDIFRREALSRVQTVYEAT